MAEAVGLASGLLTLTVFAFESSVTLHNTIKSFQSHNTRVRDLAEELQGLAGVLGPLNETVNSITDVDLSCLDLPLLRCGKACQEFQQELLKCLSRSGGSRTSFRDWAKLRYMGSDIDGFRRLLKGYKLTIIIALTDANQRKSSHTSESIESFKDLVQTASDDLQAHLDGINEKLEMVLKRAVPETAADSDEPRRMKEERLSTQRCLQICDQSSEHISQIPIPSRPPAGTVDPDTTPESLINDELQECQANLTAAAAKFEIHMKELTERLVARSRAGTATQDDADDLTRLHDEWETTRQCLSICSKVDGHLKANVSIIENYATGDAVQFMVSTNGKVLHGKNHGLGQRTRQFGGYMSEKLVAQLSKDMANTGLHDPERDASARRAKSRDDTEDADETDPVADAWQRHGRGIRLANKHAPGLPRSVPVSAAEGQGSLATGSNPAR